MSFIHIDTDGHFSDMDGCIDGVAKVEVEAERCFDRDIGGTDGIECSAEIYSVRIGKFEIDRNQLCDAFGKSMVEDFEEKAAREYLQEIAA